MKPSPYHAQPTSIDRLRCLLEGHPGWQSQQRPDGTWTDPRCPRCGVTRMQKERNTTSPKR